MKRCDDGLCFFVVLPQRDFRESLVLKPFRNFRGWGGSRVVVVVQRCRNNRFVEGRLPLLLRLLRSSCCRGYSCWGRSPRRGLGVAVVMVGVAIVATFGRIRRQGSSNRGTFWLRPGEGHSKIRRRRRQKLNGSVGRNLSRRWMVRFAMMMNRRRRKRNERYKTWRRRTTRRRVWRTSRTISKHLAFQERNLRKCSP